MREWCDYHGVEDIESIKIKEEITHIFSSAFSSYKSLKSIFIPKNVRYIDYLFLKGCEIIEINVDKNNKNFKSLNGDLYDKKMKTLVQYSVGKINESFEIPKEVEKINDFAFSNSKHLKKIYFSNNIKVIGAYAFSNCSALEVVEFLGHIKDWQKIKKCYGYKEKVSIKAIKCADGMCEF